MQKVDLNRQHRIQRLLLDRRGLVLAVGRFWLTSWEPPYERPVFHLDLAEFQIDIDTGVLSPDGSLLLLAEIMTDSSAPPPRQCFQVWDARTGQLLRTFQGHTSSAWALAWSPDNRRALSGGYDRTARVWDVTTGQQLLCLEGGSHWVTSVAWSPDGTRVLTGSYDGTVRAWDAATGRELFSHLCASSGDRIASVAWHPDGRRILTSSEDSTLRLWDGDKRQVLLDRDTARAIHGAAFSPDGSCLLYTEGGWPYRVLVLDVATGQELLRLRVKDGAYGAVWSLDGRRILATQGCRYLLSWDVGTGLFDPLAPVLARSQDIYALLDLYEEGGMESSILECYRGDLRQEETSHG